eukprot:TRINITY_DN17444_c0_g1_i8.p1 TRINITY_DN17444_c0_g1~~TRINITY_DN17444_c0_g1_i8.p1  ORF type:complete len:226 (+),score=42.50 TRINITY_DN17444_c0_g1_i8:212-889(+)
MSGSESQEMETDNEQASSAMETDNAQASSAEHRLVSPTDSSQSLESPKISAYQDAPAPTPEQWQEAGGDQSSPVFSADSTNREIEERFEDAAEFQEDGARGPESWSLSADQLAHEVQKQLLSVPDIDKIAGDSTPARDKQFSAPQDPEEGDEEDLTRQVQDIGPATPTFNTLPVTPKDHHVKQPAPKPTTPNGPQPAQHGQPASMTKVPAEMATQDTCCSACIIA